MVGILLCIIAGAIIFALGTRSARRSGCPEVLYTLMAGFGLRMVLQTFGRDLPIFSFGAGGDCIAYEDLATTIVQIWDQNGVSFIEQDRLPEIGLVSLPPNLFALVAYANGTMSRAGCTALIALAAALTFLNIFELARELGAETRSAFWMATLFVWEPAYVLYTSDMYKDGIVVALTLGALGSAIRLGRRLSVVHLAIGIGCVISLAYVRNYLIYVTVAPLLVGLVGFRSNSLGRTVSVLTLEIVAALIFANMSNTLRDAAATAQDTFEFATTDSLMSNTEGGSGVVFAGDTPFASFGTKLVYTLFSPFPWQTGSIAFHVGKVDAAVLIYFLYRSVRAVTRAPFVTVLTVLAFIVPCTIMYTTTMANIGLIVRQRLVIVAGLAVMAALYTPKRKGFTAEDYDGDEDEDKDKDGDDEPSSSDDAEDQPAANAPPQPV